MQLNSLIKKRNILSIAWNIHSLATVTLFPNYSIVMQPKETTLNILTNVTVLYHICGCLHGKGVHLHLSGFQYCAINKYSIWKKFARWQDSDRISLIEKVNPLCKFLLQKVLDFFSLMVQCAQRNILWTSSAYCWSVWSSYLMASVCRQQWLQSGYCETRKSYSELELILYWKCLINIQKLPIQFHISPLVYILYSPHYYLLVI